MRLPALFNFYFPTRTSVLKPNFIRAELRRTSWDLPKVRSVHWETPMICHQPKYVIHSRIVDYACQVGRCCLLFFFAAKTQTLNKALKKDTAEDI